MSEFKFENAADYNLADEIKADFFAEGDKIDATAISKGKGFRVRSRDMVSTEDLWRTVLNSTVIRVLTVLVLRQVRYSKEKECLDRWDM